MAQIGGSKTVSTARVTEHVTRADRASAGDVADTLGSKIAGSKTTVTGRVSKHVARPARGPKLR